MTHADLLIQALLEAVEVGDDGVHLQPTKPSRERVVPDGYDSYREFNIHHPVHGFIGRMYGYHNEDRGEFLVDYVSLVHHPHYKEQDDIPRDLKTNVKFGTDNYEGASRTLIKAGLRSLMRHIPGLKTITGHTRITGTHAIAAKGGDGPLSNTSIKIPRRMRQAAS